MAQVDLGPATGTASLYAGTPPTASVEVHVPAGTNPNPPMLSPYVDVQCGTTLNGTTAVNKTGIAGNIIFVSPA